MDRQTDTERDGEMKDGSREKNTDKERHGEKEIGVDTDMRETETSTNEREVGAERGGRRQVEAWGGDTVTETEPRNVEMMRDGMCRERER